ncbi:TetR/AcrR family transcriptional regulator [Spirochaeta dissipatitropha]
MDAATSKGRNSREHIVRAALRVFMRQGYEAASFTALCKAAGISKGAVYHYFTGKDDLYYHCLLDFFGNTSESHWTTDPAESLHERIELGFKYVDIFRQRIQDRFGLHRDDAILHFYSFLYEATRKYPEFQRRMDAGDDRKHSNLREEFRQAQDAGEIRADLDPEILVLELDALLQQLLYFRFVNHRIKNDTQLLQRMFASYWQRLIPQGKESK